VKIYMVSYDNEEDHYESGPVFSTIEKAWSFVNSEIIFNENPFKEYLNEIEDYFCPWNIIEELTLDSLNHEDVIIHKFVNQGDL